MRYTYHYHAMRQQRSGGVAHYDGLIVRGAPVTTGDEYFALKEAILEKYEPVENRHGLTICSLSLLSAVEEDDVD